MEKPQRRSFLEWCIHGLGGIFALVLGVPVVAYVLDARNRKTPAKDFRPVDGVNLADLRAREGTVVAQGVIRDARRDAWTLHPSDVLGRVWVVKSGDGSNLERDLKVFTNICPHLGCAVNHTGQTFTCPCHNGKFELNGTRQEEHGYTNPAPRNMDALEFREDPANPQVLLVKYQTFIQGAATREVRS